MFKNTDLHITKADQHEDKLWTDLYLFIILFFRLFYYYFKSVVCIHTCVYVLLEVRRGHQIPRKWVSGTAQYRHWEMNCRTAQYRHWRLKANCRRAAIPINLKLKILNFIYLLHMPEHVCAPYTCQHLCLHRCLDACTVQSTEAAS